MKQFNIYLLCVAAFATLLLQACDKPQVGYLSNNIFYKVNPYNVTQGVTTYSSPIVGNGSTTPLNVELLRITNADGDDVTEELTTPYSIVTYKGTVTYQDTTLEMLYAKLSDSTVAPFHVNPIGGRLEFTMATSYVNIGSYFADVKVSNTAGTRELTNAVNFNIKALTLPYEITYRAASTSTMGAEVFSSAPAPEITITHDVTGENYIIFKFVDKNGAPFDPSAGEIIKRGDRPTFANWEPWYDEVKTDTGYVYQYPQVPSMPAFNETNLNGALWNGGICYYRIVGTYNDLGVNVNPVFTIRYNLPGTYVVTIKLTNVERI